VDDRRLKADVCDEVGRGKVGERKKEEMEEMDGRGEKSGRGKDGEGDEVRRRKGKGPIARQRVE
jgi:hypothetical protein